MWTVCWSDSHGTDHFERCGSRREVAALLIRYSLEKDPDVFIFPPEADSLTINAEDVFSRL